MLKSNRNLLRLCNAFVCIEMILWIVIQTSIGNNYLRYLTVLLAFLVCFLFAEKTKSYAFTHLALLFTLIADYFLILADVKNQLFAMIFFCGTQIFYFFRMASEEKNYNILKRHLIFRCAVIILVFIATYLFLGDNTDALALVSMFYYSNLLLNIVLSLALTKKSPLLTIGLICFILCDTFVGLANLGSYFSISGSSLIYKLLYPGVDPVWIFYVPSQTFLAISLLNNHKQKKRV